MELTRGVTEQGQRSAVLLGGGGTANWVGDLEEKAGLPYSQVQSPPQFLSLTKQMTLPSFLNEETVKQVKARAEVSSKKPSSFVRRKALSLGRVGWGGKTSFPTEDK